MKGNGYITIFIIFILTISIIIVQYIVHLVNNHIHIEAAYQDKIQAELLVESKVLRLFCDEHYFNELIVPKINHYFRNQSDGKASSFKLNFETNIDERDLDKEVNGYFFNNNNRKYMGLDAKTTYNGFTSNVVANGTIVNDLFEMNNNPVVSYDLDFDKCIKLEHFYNNLYENIKVNDLPDGIKGIHTYDHEIIRLRKKDSKHNEVIKVRNDTESIETFNKDIFLVVKNKINTPIELIIDDNLDISGVIFLEGNLVINSKFKFKGIIILKGVDSNIIVNTIEVPVFQGIVFTEGGTSFYDQIDLRYDSGYIYKYGVNLPGFLEPNLEVLKKQ